MSRILSYRGLLEDGGQDTILLSTKKGEAGYRIVKFQIMGPDANTDMEIAIQIWKVEQTTIDANIDFSDNRLLATAVINDTTDRHYQPLPIIIFDQEIVNQDIYVTNGANQNASPVNYYIELETIKLSEQEAMVATIMNIRNG